MDVTLSENQNLQTLDEGMGGLKLCKPPVIHKKVFANKDFYERANYIYQAAMQILTLQPHNIELVRYYMKCLRDVKEKKVLQFSDEMQDTICSYCDMLLVPGITAHVKHTDVGNTAITCLSCNVKKVKQSELPHPKCKKRKRNKSKKCRKMSNKKTNASLL